MGVTAVRLLSSLCLLVIIVQAQDCSRPVGGPNMDLKGNDILLTDFPDGTKVTFACNTGYVSAGGSASVTCTAGSWSPVRLKCERRSCGAVDEVENGQIEYQPGNQFGDKAVVICNTGYQQVGKGTLTCGVQGWEGRLPVCEVVKCESPPTIVDGSFSPAKDTYDYSEVIQYTCKRDYSLIGTSQLSCSDDGTFTPVPPTCIMVRCEEPQIPNGFWSGGARPPYGYLSTVTLECNPGYKMNGNALQKCDTNNQWMPGLPSCTQQPTIPTPTTTTTTTTTTTLSTPTKPTVAEECEDPRKINPKVTVSSQPPYRQSHKVTLSCPSGDKLGGQSTVTCGKNGLWVPKIPDCETEDGGSSGSSVLVPVLITLLVLIIAVSFILFGMRHFGVAPFKRKTKGARRDNTDKEAPNEGEDVALS